MDIQWSARWKSEVVSVAELLRRKGIPLHVIYNGAPSDHSDAEWIAHALSNAQAFESVVKPDAVAFMSWTEYPKRLLPESDLATMTGLINEYLSWQGKRAPKANP
jgi:hypothetical protein